MHQHNGEYCCSHCLQSGEEMLNGQRSVCLYPYKYSNPNFSVCTAIETDEHLLKGVATYDPVFGVKWLSW